MYGGIQFLLVIVLNVFVLAVIYVDAKRNSPRPAILWVLAVLITGILPGLFVYFLVGRDPGHRDRRRRQRDRRATRRRQTVNEYAAQTTDRPDPDERRRGLY